MGLFKKKEKKAGEVRPPEPLKLPELPEVKEGKDKRFIHQLPRFPNDSLGEKFSQSTIKDAITGGKEGRGAYAEEFASEDELQMMHKPHIKEIPEERQSGEFPYPVKKVTKRIPIQGEVRDGGEKTPIFVRMDRFEEGLQSLGRTKKLVSEIEKLLGDVKRTKEEERKELEFWEKQIQDAKVQIEKIDRNIFSKIEHG